MFCTKCGKDIPENASFCPSCAAPVNVQYQQQTAFAQQPVTPQQTAAIQEPAKVTDWLIPGIIATVCCCLPLGVVSIVFAAQANSQAQQGNYEEAQKTADKAKLFFILSIVLGLIGVVLYIFLQIIMAAAANC